MVISSSERRSGQAFLDRIAWLAARVRQGELIVHLRDRELPVRERAALGRALLQRTRERHHRVIINDRLDLALALGADGAHLPEAGVSPRDARSLLGVGAWISRAVHSRVLELSDGALDAVVLSPVVAPRKGRQALGVAAWRGVRPVSAGLYALGGGGAPESEACLRGGADGIAVISAALGSDEPIELLTALGGLDDSNRR